MFGDGTAPGQAWAAAVIAIAVSALIGLAACGSASGGAGRPAAGGGHSTRPTGAGKASAGVPLCAAAGQLDRAVLSTPASQARAILPRRVTISDASRVRAMAAALCALPPSPAVARCPAPLGGAVRLVFAAGGRVFPPVRIQDSGCPHVTGAGPARVWSWSSLPGRLLSEAVGGKGRLIPGAHPSSVPVG